jgi:DNA invertase Pin-like site-specific DNA recombinase
MKVGYARTSTADQIAGLEAQIRDLRTVGVEELFQEQLSSVDAKRPQLEAALTFIRKGDVLIVTKIDRLARSVGNLVDIERRIHAKDASLQVLDPGLDTSTSIGRLVFNVIASIAQFEREIMLERQREGIAKAKAEGKYKGRKPTARAREGEIRELIKAGLSHADIAERLKISRASVYRIAPAKKHEWR